MIWEAEFDYFIQQINSNCWKIYKVDGHYKVPSATYTVMLHRGVYQCDCPAPKYCKHIDQVKQLLNPRKDLF
jgi:hypothetical protein